MDAHANLSALRRIERPALPPEAFDLLGVAIARRHVAGGVVYSHLGPVAYPELVAQFADPDGNVLGLYQEPAGSART